uniref:Uncharacterized protein n=1 Tax=Anguilla anguilla TaxID=7936 RepID=A0A0E9TAT5_ANGAN
MPYQTDGITCKKPKCEDDNMDANILGLNAVMTWMKHSISVRVTGYCHRWLLLFGPV